MAEPLIQFTKIKKTNMEFNRFHSDRYHRVKKAWRKPRGIDNRVRRKLRGAIKMPGKRYMNDEIVRHILPNGFKKVLVSNVNELQALVGLNRFYCAEIRHAIGAKKRIEIVNKAREMDILVLNETARLIEENKE
ncbi:60S ribosomal protein L32 [Conglomerata obtusa]